ncbi:hypothetical protein DYB28_006854 [Aphanomyces astaci]|uniref:Ribosomal protein n=1 Tax=Aphanomyces astaci TaxID=112090 RepID=A0A397DEX0_APHAT|nr:hypothetical protein DYB34_000530 [Aphanomyces astaci]RHY64053.1 hypothetical protein DYB38_000991 [Aphanomyces astaci]RHY79715.1 hypothetical protein DYB31_000806 [Aphanomyces astaci]RLO13568.1 hypothetical protein DYB28_006854 [Aphanomyces astaci]
MALLFRGTAAASLAGRMHVRSIALASRFPETVLELKDPEGKKSVRSVVTLPHGTGKVVRVAVFAKGDKADEARAAGATIVGAEDLLADIQAGKLDFDRCVATPDMMALVGRVARVRYAAKGGQVEFRAEKKGIVHAGVGKVSFSDDALLDNIRAFMVAVGEAKPEGAKGKYVKACHLSSTMGHGIRLDPRQLDPSSPQFMRFT